MTIEVAGTDATEVVDRHGIRGLALGAETTIHLASPAGVIDLGIAHSGTPPTVVAYTEGKRVANRGR